MAILIQEYWEIIRNPFSSDTEKEKACIFFRDLWESILYAQYVRYLNFEPMPTPVSVIEQLANQQFLINQLVLNALGDPSPQPSIFSYIRENQLHLDVAKQLLTRFEQAADEMRQIVETERTHEQLIKEKKS